MSMKTFAVLSVAGAAIVAATLAAQERPARGGGGGIRANPPVDLALKPSFDVPAADEKTTAIVAAAQAFLATLTDAQRAAAMFALDDNVQRANWSNFPHPTVARKGVMRGDMTDAQRTALDALLAEALGEDGFNNVRWQLAADDAADTGQAFPQFGSEYYFVAFLGEPATDAPWVLQFGGHHLAINATVFGPDIAFAPMLTGGEPLHITHDGREIFITEEEVTAAQALLESLSDEQKAKAVRSDTRIGLVLGPGQDGVTIAPEGIRATDLTAEQRELLVALIGKRVGLFNADDAGVKMAQAQADLDETWFGWWGPQDKAGTAYYRITAPGLVIEYSPEDGGSSDDHAHNMYRDPANDYGRAWLAE